MWRSKSFRSGIWYRVLMGFAALYLLAILLFMGIGVYFILEEEGFSNPLSEMNSYLFYYIAYDLVFRFMLQKMPVTQIQPLLSQPIRRSAIVNFSLTRTLYAFFNWSHLFLLLPLSVVLVAKGGYDLIGVAGWVVAVMGLIYTNNFLNVLVNNSDRIFYPALVVLVGLGLSQYFGLFDITVHSRQFFDFVYQSPLISPVFVVVALIAYAAAFSFFRSKLYLDGFLKAKASKFRNRDLGWLDRFGQLGVFLRNDIRMITRNKRPRMTLITAGVFLFYGLLFFTGSIEIYEGPYWGLFAGLFVTGGWVFTFGQFIPSWDSAYYPFMMTQNIPYRNYLDSKWWLMVIGTGVSIILSLPYMYFGMDALLAVITAGIFNLGVNSHMVIWGGAYVKTPLDLTATNKAFGDSKSLNAKTMVLIIPKLLLPMLLYYLGTFTGQAYAGYVFVALAGLMGFLLKGRVFDLVEKTYFREKYATLKAYKED